MNQKSAVSHSSLSSNESDQSDDLSEPEIEEFEVKHSSFPVKSSNKDSSNEKDLGGKKEMSGFFSFELNNTLSVTQSSNSDSQDHRNDSADTAKFEIKKEE